MFRGDSWQICLDRPALAVTAAVLSLLILLPAEHVYGDFVFQSVAMAQGKRHRLLPLLAHVAIHGRLVYAILQQAVGWQVPIAVMVLHGLIDAIKSRCSPSASAFAWDQAAHAASLIVVAWLGVR